MALSLSGTSLETAAPATPGTIVVRGARVHNLKGIDLDLPAKRLIVVCGPSGAGKTSLAIDTLYAEGQRRYIESFSAYQRQFLERLDKPDADRIEGIPPAIAVTRAQPSKSNRSTVGAATEVLEHLRLLFARAGTIVCVNCGTTVKPDSPQSAAESLQQLSEGTKLQVGFATTPARGVESTAKRIQQQGFLRAVVNGRTVSLSDLAAGPVAEVASGADSPTDREEWIVIVDRLTAGAAGLLRLRESLETAFQHGAGRAVALLGGEAEVLQRALGRTLKATKIDDTGWSVAVFSRSLECPGCGGKFLQPEPRLLSFNNPLGACPVCEGFGDVTEINCALVVPEPQKSLAEGAIAPWRTPSFAHELAELTALAKDYDLRMSVPYSELSERELSIVQDGVPERKFGGLKGFFAWLDRRKYKLQYRAFFSRFRSFRKCEACDGQRLRPEALAVRLGARNLPELCALSAADAREYLENLSLDEHAQRVGRMPLQLTLGRLKYLQQVGLGYLTLDRPLRTLSSGEMQRIALSSALGTALVGMLYVLDEPTAGLHPVDSRRVLTAIRALADRGNTVLAVEHDPEAIAAADYVVELGPAAGERGGNVVYAGLPTGLRDVPQSPTGRRLAAELTQVTPKKLRKSRGLLRLRGASGHNLQNIDVDFPLGVMCVVTGVSGAGKSSLVEQTLYPALRQKLGKPVGSPLAYAELTGDAQIDDVLLVDQSPVSKSPSSNPATYLKVFDEIREAFAESPEAKIRNFTPGNFSFNVAGGRCETCEGDGVIKLDMQFMADVYMRCAECHGARYRPQILEVTLRGLNIADVLNLSVREAFTFFRGRAKIQSKLKRLIDLGLEYLRLGQAAPTLSGGESQRLKLAAHLVTVKRSRTLLILDEPSTGLHMDDIAVLQECLDALLAVGNSLIVIDHHLALIEAADHVIDLGPGPAENGGRVVASGTPAEIAAVPESLTGECLRVRAARRGGGHV